MKRSARETIHSRLKSWTWLLTVILATFAFRSAIADWSDVPTGSMRPTIIEGDRIFVYKLAYDFKIPFTTRHIASWSGPERGDIVVFFSPADGTRLVKRVIGLPGDTIEMRNERLVINGVMTDYDALDDGVFGNVPTDGEPERRFLTENLPGAPHTVTIIPLVPAIRTFGPIEVPEGRYFMLGDNRDNSADSRYFGFVPRKSIVGKVKGVAFSLRYDEYFLPRWDRFMEGLR